MTNIRPKELIVYLDGEHELSGEQGGEVNGAIRVEAKLKKRTVNPSIPKIAPAPLHSTERCAAVNPEGGWPQAGEPFAGRVQPLRPCVSCRRSLMFSLTDGKCAAQQKERNKMRRQYLPCLFYCLAAVVCLAGCQEETQCECEAGLGCLKGDASKVKDIAVQKDAATATTPYTVLRQLLQGRHSANPYTSNDSFSKQPLSKEDITSMLWAGQGINRPGKPTGRAGVTGLRTAPSAGALYPIELYVAVNSVSGVDPGLYWYRPEKDEMQLVEKKSNLSSEIAGVAMGQQVLKQAAAIFVVAAVGARTAKKYGTRAEAYVWIEVGHVTQNMILMAEARGFDSRPVAGFTYATMQTALKLPLDHIPGYLLPVGSRP